MATNNLLVNNEYKVLRESRNKVERSPHNLSQSRKFPVEIGKIYPIFCRKTLPSDSFKIDANILVKQLQPLLVPQMVSFSVQTAFYWVDYSLAWPEFEYFLINQQGDQTLELPYFQDVDTNGLIATVKLGSLTSQSTSSTTKSRYQLLDNVRSFLDITAKECDEKIDALPFWTYQRILRDFYTNIDRLSESEYNVLFPVNPRNTQLQSGPNHFFTCKDGYDRTSTKIHEDECSSLTKLGVHNVRGDYFVNSYPTPIRGETPTLSNNLTISEFQATLSQEQFTLENTYSKPLAQSTFKQNDIVNAQINSSGEFVIDNGTIEPTPLFTRPHPGNLGSFDDFFSTVSRNFDTIKNNISGLTTNPTTFSNIQNLVYSLPITTRELRLLDAITRKREIDILMKPRLKNYLQTYFGVNNYKDDSLYQPIFIGSTTQQILINDIEQTTTTDTSPLGRQGATAISLADNYVGEYYCRNYGCLMGVMFILPDYDYEPGLPHEWSERTPDDFYNPEYAHLSMQAILNKELFVSNDSDWNNQVLGYGGVYDYYRASNNYVSSLFLSPSGENEDIKQFAQVRRFTNSNKPEITTRFLDSNSAFDMSVFAVPTMPPFMCQAVTRVRAVRPLPELATPDSSR